MIFADPDNNTIAMWQPMKKKPVARAAKAVKKSAKKVAVAKQKAKSAKTTLR